MKYLIAPLLVLISVHAFCQTGLLTGRITKADSSLDYNYLTVSLKQADSTVSSTMPDRSGFFTLYNIPAGHYTLVITQLGYRDAVTDSVIVANEKTTTLTLPYPPPCKFIYGSGKRLVCIGGHTDQIVPILYGLPSKKTMNRANRGLVHLGGCMITDCDPLYYCKAHQKEL